MRTTYVTSCSFRSIELVVVLSAIRMQNVAYNLTVAGLTGMPEGRSAAASRGARAGHCPRGPEVSAPISLSLLFTFLRTFSLLLRLITCRYSSFAHILFFFGG